MNQTLFSIFAIIPIILKCIFYIIGTYALVLSIKALKKYLGKDEPTSTL